MIEDFDLQDLVEMQMREEKMGIYLGGPVTPFLEDTPSYAASWREEFLKSIEHVTSYPDAFLIHNPVAGQYDAETLGFEQDASNMWRYSDSFILDRCIHQMVMSDILVFNFLEADADYGLGTPWEMGFTFALKTKYTILIAEANSAVANHPIIKMSTNFVARNLYEAAQYCDYISKKSTNIKS